MSAVDYSLNLNISVSLIAYAIWHNKLTNKENFEKCAVYGNVNHPSDIPEHDMPKTARKSIERLKPVLLFGYYQLGEKYANQLIKREQPTPDLTKINKLSNDRQVEKTPELRQLRMFNYVAGMNAVFLKANKPAPYTTKMLDDYFASMNFRSVVGRTHPLAAYYFRGKDFCLQSQNKLQVNLNQLFHLCIDEDFLNSDFKLIRRKFYLCVEGFNEGLRESGIQYAFTEDKVRVAIYSLRSNLALQNNIKKKLKAQVEKKSAENREKERSERVAAKKKAEKKAEKKEKKKAEKEQAEKKKKKSPDDKFIDSIFSASPLMTKSRDLAKEMLVKEKEHLTQSTTPGPFNCSDVKQRI